MYAKGYVSVRELVAELDGRLSRNAIYAGIHNGEIPHIRVGKRILLPSDALDRMLTEQSVSSTGAQQP